MRVVAVLSLSLVLGLPLAAINRGDVLLEHRTNSPHSEQSSGYDLWLHTGFKYAMNAGGWPLLYKAIPYYGSGRFFIPAPDQMVFHHERTVSTWDGVLRVFTEEGKGYNEIFTADTDLGEIAPMRSGNFLVAERWNDRERGAKLIEFNGHGRLAEYRLPELLTSDDRALGATHIELLADQCTVLYTSGADHPAVRRFNICTRRAEADFAALTPGAYAGAIRKLPNGDVLVANGNAVLHFTADGGLLRMYPVRAVTHLALSADGATFWAAGVDRGMAYLRHFDPAAANPDLGSVPIGNPGMVSLGVPVETGDLVVVGEWRTATVPVKTRTRAARH